MQTQEKRIGRPRIEIDWAKLDKACLVGATLLECAALLECGQDTVTRAIQQRSGLSFAEYRDSKEAANRILLRERQYSEATTGDKPHNVTDRIWMGKQKLGQRDKYEHEHTVAPELMDYYRELKESEAKMLPDVIEGEVIDAEG